MYNQKNKRLRQIDLSIIGIIIIILILFHSIYLLVTEKKKILNIETISDENIIIQSLINRVIAFFVVLMFFIFSVSNYRDLLQGSNKKQINNQKIRIFVSSFSLLSVTIEIYLTLKELISINEQNNIQN